MLPTGYRSDSFRCGGGVAKMFNTRSIMQSFLCTGRKTGRQIDIMLKLRDAVYTIITDGEIQNGLQHRLDPNWKEYGVKPYSLPRS